MEPRHIIIADDEKLLCLTIADYLRDEGYNVTIVHDGDEILPVIEREPVDLVLLDLMMPRMDGLKALSLIKKQAPQTRVIIVSGYGTKRHVGQAEQLGADGFIDKPLGIETLLRYIKTVLAGAPRPPFHEPAIE